MYRNTHRSVTDQVLARCRIFVALAGLTLLTVALASRAQGATDAAAVTGMGQIVFSTETCKE